MMDTNGCPSLVTPPSGTPPSVTPPSGTPPSVTPPSVTPPSVTINAAPPRLPRSPSHESISTELSLFSVSSVASEGTAGRTGLRVLFPSSLARGPSPTPEGRFRLQVPTGGSRGGNSTCGGSSNGDKNSPNFWGEEEVDLIRSCALLSLALGVQKSFSTSDINDFENNEPVITSWVSDGKLFCGGLRMENILLPRLDPASRSCSTWVAVGDVTSTSQLPSPQARLGDGPTLTTADFIRSFNKKVRQSYLKKRLMTTYKAVQRFTQSDLYSELSKGTGITKVDKGAATVTLDKGAATVTLPGRQAAQDVFRIIRKEVELPNPAAAPSPSAGGGAGARKFSLTARDVERDRGRQLTKYERNIIIFNWLQTLEESTLEVN